MNTKFEQKSPFHGWKKELHLYNNSTISDIISRKLRSASYLRQWIRMLPMFYKKVRAPLD